jgi:hypothetical protein
VQRAISGFISETAIEYRSSGVVFDHGGDGDLRAGDRLPDVSLSGGSTLLGRWTSGKALAILVDADDSASRSVGSAFHHAEVLKLNPAELDDNGRKQFGEKPCLLIVRPDGYIGFRGAPDRAEDWINYFRLCGL